MFKYNYSAIDDTWIMSNDDRLILSITRQTVAEYQDKYFSENMTELNVFKTLAANIIIDRFDKCGNEFLISSVMKYLFD